MPDLTPAALVAADLHEYVRYRTDDSKWVARGAGWAPVPIRDVAHYLRQAAFGTPVAAALASTLDNHISRGALLRTLSEAPSFRTSHAAVWVRAHLETTPGAFVAKAAVYAAYTAATAPEQQVPRTRFYTAVERALDIHRVAQDSRGRRGYRDHALKTDATKEETNGQARRTA